MRLRPKVEAAATNARMLLERLDQGLGEQAGAVRKILRADPIACLSRVAGLREGFANFVGQILLLRTELAILDELEISRRDGGIVLDLPLFGGLITRR